MLLACCKLFVTWCLPRRAFSSFLCHRLYLLQSVRRTNRRRTILKLQNWEYLEAVERLARRRREKMTVVEWQPDTEKMWHGMVCKIAPKLHTRPRPCPDGLKWGRCNCDLYSNFPQRTSPWHLKFILGSMFKTTVSAVAICLSSSYKYKRSQARCRNHNLK